MREPFKGNLLSIIGLTIISLAIIIMLSAGYLAFVPMTVIKPQVQPYKVLTPIVSPGKTLIYQVDACKYREAVGAIVRSFVDSNGVTSPLPAVTGTVKKGCTKTNVPVIVPPLHPGIWYITLDVGYKVNPLRTEYYHLVTDKFTIEVQ